MALLNSEDQEKVVHAISQAEGMTSGEIRVVVENTVMQEDIMQKATHYFEELEMHNTLQRNGVLIYLAIADHRFAIIGDVGIDEKVEGDFWECTKNEMLTFFRQGDFAGGLVAGIQNAGKQLQHYFPRQEDDINELPNDIYFGKH
ncbi:TPM domain-containing protein [Parapedobacter sp. SGR-10]|uniref:TPM domain-containing protein n=1 Tax=Parapedobacter sp. SGR-10 TaxID=2710879 RepID=UPI0013D31D7B|nr:TPM domain-containing protein [Parapedobacter sp. SGR-10]NGF58301.1 TPM domain-containing protein [Parapedobacter sp. SGR-10]